MHVAELDDEHAEARFVAAEIERLRDEEGIAPSEIAVFYRTNAQSRVLEDTLVRFGVAYQVIGGTKFYERAEIKDALAYLTLLVNPADAVSFARIVNSPKRGIGQTTVRPRGRAREHDGRCPCSRSPRCRELVPGLGPAGREGAGPLRLDDRAAARARRAHSVGRDLLESTLQETGYFEALEAERTIEAQGRLENLHELIGVAREFDANWEGERGLPALAEFLQQLSLYSEQDAPARRATSS